MKKMTYGDSMAVIVLAADKLGLRPAMVADAQRQLAGEPLHPMTGAALEKEATRIHNRIRLDAALVAKANFEAEVIQQQYGFKAPQVLLAEFDVAFEDVGFTSVDLSGRELTETEAAGYTQVAVQEGTLPAGVVAVVRGHVADDDERDEEGERKVFVNITLRVRAKDEQAAEAFVPPQDLLTKLADLIASDDASENPLALEGNWEVSTVDAASVAEPSADSPSLPGVAFKHSQEAAPIAR